MANADRTRPASDMASSGPIVDVTDLVYYVGAHHHVTGVQRVQAAIITALLESGTPATFVSFAATEQRFVKLDPNVLGAVLREISLPPAGRTFAYDRALARAGLLPGFADISYEDAPTMDGHCILVIGTAWTVDDYFRHLNIFRYLFRARLVFVIHDLVAIHASETCHEAVAKVFRRFLWESRNVTNLYICVSQNTERDLVKYFAVNDWPRPRTAVIHHGTDIPSVGEPQRPEWLAETPRGHVLFVSTIEARKNHAFLFKIWSRLLASLGAALPGLICIGRIGWRSSEFLVDYLASNGLSGTIEIRSDVADRELAYLYETSRFTVYPSLYEGWGLPVTESLAFGKLCVCSKTSSMPEAGGDLVVYIDPTDVGATCETLERLIKTPAEVEAAEARIRTSFKPRRWREVATDYLSAVDRVARDNVVDAMPRLPTHCVFRRWSRDFGDCAGDALLAQVKEHLRSDLQADPLQLSDFENGRNARWTGDWNIQEDWGCWIGLRGASLRFLSSDERRYVARFACRILDPFKGTLLEVRVNDVSSFHRLSEGPMSTFTLEFAALRGANTITFHGSPTPEQKERSLAIDGRGLMLGLREMVCVAAASPPRTRQEDPVGERADMTRVGERGGMIGVAQRDTTEDGKRRSTMPLEAANGLQNAFAGGTLLLTERGEVPVEQLAPGDRVATYSGRNRQIRRILNGEAQGATAVRIPANAVGEGKPKRDLRVTSDAHVCLKIVSECLVPVDQLVTKSTFDQSPAAGETFWQILLDGDDDILLTDGLPMQSGPDVDHLDLDRVDDRRLIEMIRAVLRGRAASLGWRLVEKPALDLHVLADGERIEPAIDDMLFRFVLSPSASDVWLMSECSIPKEVGINTDGRLLGTCLSGMRLEDGLRVSRQIALDDPLLDVGFHNFEGQQRWTDGCAKLSSDLWRDCRDPFFLTVSLAFPALPRYCPR